MSTENNRGLVASQEVLLALFEAYPEATMFITLRNYSNIHKVIHLGLFIESEIEEEGKAYLHRVDAEMFLPTEIVTKLKATEKEGYVAFGQFRKLGQEIANLAKRKIVLIHQMGGDLTMSSNKIHTFKPQKEKK